jgi:predicted GNAT family N-acyltransferase
MAVDTTVQKTGVGRMMLFFAESTARDHGYKTVVMHARDGVLPFYQKCGYSIAGDQFYEVGIPHHKMHKMLSPENGQPE